MPETFPSSSQHTRSGATLSPTAENVTSLEPSALEDPFGLELDGSANTTNGEDVRREPNKRVGPTELTVSAFDDGVPVNPFRRALATLEDPSHAAAKVEKDRMGFESVGAPSDNAKASLDVDAFKRLLLTGSPSALHSSAPSTPPTHLNAYQGTQGNHGDSNSNTDASSISRQSIFEPHPEAPSDTPRTSHEVSISDDEQSDLEIVSSPSAMRTARLTSNSRHGKALREQAPRTVSFTDPTLSLSGFEPTAATYRNEPSLSSLRSTTDLNKPLPLAPSSQSPEQESSTVGFFTKSAPANQPPEAGGVPITQKRIPPAPPLARRHSQLRSQNTSSNPERSATIQKEKQAGLLSRTPPKPPPPPPPRRKGSGQSIPSGDNAPGLSEVPVASVQVEQTLDRPPVKVQPVKPPPPPTRTPSVSSIKRPARVSSGASSTAMAPPPPPPRRRGSSQSSLTDPRPSGEYRRTSTESYRGEPTASLVNQSIPESSSELEARNGNVLADLSALQKEVDALRGKYEESKMKD